MFEGSTPRSMIASTSLERTMPTAPEGHAGFGETKSSVSVPPRCTAALFAPRDHAVANNATDDSRPQWHTHRADVDAALLREKLERFRTASDGAQAEMGDARTCGGNSMKRAVLLDAVLSRAQGWRSIRSAVFSVWVQISALARSGFAASTQEPGIALRKRWAFAVWEAHLVLRRGRQRSDVLHVTLKELSKKVNADLILGECMHERALAARDERWEWERNALISQVATLQLKLLRIGGCSQEARRAAGSNSDSADAGPALNVVGDGTAMTCRSDHVHSRFALLPSAMRQVTHMLDAMAKGIEEEMQAPDRAGSAKQGQQAKQRGMALPSRRSSIIHSGKGFAKMESMEGVLQRAQMARCFMMWTLHVQQSHGLVAFGCDRAAATLSRDWEPEDCHNTCVDTLLRASVSKACQVYQAPSGQLLDISQTQFLKDACTQAVELIASDCQTDKMRTQRMIGLEAPRASTALTPEMMMAKPKEAFAPQALPLHDSEEDASSSSISETSPEDATLAEHRVATQRLQQLLQEKIAESKEHIEGVMLQMADKWRSVTDNLKARRDFVLDRTIANYNHCLMACAWALLVVWTKQERFIGFLRVPEFRANCFAVCVCFRAWAEVQKRSSADVMQGAQSFKRAQRTDTLALLRSVMSVWCRQKRFTVSGVGTPVQGLRPSGIIELAARCLCLWSFFVSSRRAIEAEGDAEVDAKGPTPDLQAHEVSGICSKEKGLHHQSTSEAAPPFLSEACLGLDDSKLDAMVREAAFSVTSDAEVLLVASKRYKIGDVEVIVQRQMDQVLGKKGHAWVPLAPLLRELLVDQRPAPAALPSNVPPEAEAVSTLKARAPNPDGRPLIGAGATVAKKAAASKRQILAPPRVTGTKVQGRRWGNL
mmetsp:Transcript_82457/g.229826  ORF Transcript_82457/g.229826 Transcript_82457/m.229826 type:complete len:883 (+) Transcript_82457:172-2820(+)